MKHPLHDAVLEQLSDDPDYAAETLAEVARHPRADAGWPGFTYYKDTCAFFEANQAAIVQLVKDMADEFGMDAVSFVAGFNCLTDDRETRDEIGRCLYGKPTDDDTTVPNALAWFALEEVARSLVSGS